MRCLNPITIKDQNNEPRHVPCGKCFGCNYNRKRDWCFRIDQEHRNSLNALFVTLTYKEEELVWGETRPTLVKQHLKTFHKSMRQATERALLKDKGNPCTTLKQVRTMLKRFTYFSVGEYGSKSGRPHYHCILFNTHPKALERIESIWDKGFVQVGILQTGGAGYVTKYMLKVTEKATDVQPEFQMMSKGIGRSYLSPRRMEFYKNTGNFVHRVNSEIVIPLPRYYRDKIFDMADKEYWQSVHLSEMDKKVNQIIEEVERKKKQNYFEREYGSIEQFIYSKTQAILKAQKL